MSNKSTKKLSRGFTLVEVLVALAIIAIALGAGLRVSGAQINNAERQGLMMRAQLCAANELGLMRLKRQLPDTGEQSFNCEQAGIAFAGKLYIQGTPNPSFRKVEAVVYQAVGDNKEANTLLKLSTIIGRF